MANENTGLHNAKRSKKDEFYTQLPDIERELRHYRHHFKDKIVYCNCDDPYIVLSLNISLKISNSWA